MIIKEENEDDYDNVEKNADEEETEVENTTDRTFSKLLNRGLVAIIMIWSLNSIAIRTAPEHLTL